MNQLKNRFGRLDQNQSRPMGRNNTNSHNNNTSVFSRLHGNNNNQHHSQGKSNIQSRLGHVSIQNRLGVQKKHGNKQAAVTKRSAPTNKFINKKPSFGKSNPKGYSPQQKNKFIQKGGKPSNKKNLKQQQKNKKPVTSESLDKALDSYMMKDPKTAQAKLDEELNSYMDDAPVDDELIGLS
ncbi:unnamed protein product [Cunninghamella blakesleeana]